MGPSGECRARVAMGPPKRAAGLPSTSPSQRTTIVVTRMPADLPTLGRFLDYRVPVSATLVVVALASIFVLPSQSASSFITYLLAIYCFCGCPELAVTVVRPRFPAGRGPARVHPADQPLVGVLGRWRGGESGCPFDPCAGVRGRGRREHAGGLVPRADDADPRRRRWHRRRLGNLRVLRRIAARMAD